ncbi:helix-turn-helix domain-containing protein [Aquimarina sp. 2201CG14-23]|uniref:helix-turn-helix domain-containing protein n=1 Tax=Aquimarina mycalae TaxID=3040073 RepID=UPI002477FBD9|nr:helix-turn-helix domain-containing protein [Aquimarina sp. 2201CG14-23]MDH7447919.1 helix-turn-helix domain-containing protein [Aquimarina sp. 2201CG14-23]
MLTNLTSNWNKYQRINFYEYNDMAVTISFDDLYSIVWIEHYDKALINFEYQKLNGHYLIFLCPEEIMTIQNYAMCKVITVPNNFEIVKSTGFIHTFGNVKKCFELDPITFHKISVLFTELEQVVDHNNNSDKLPKILSEISSLCPILTGSPNNHNLMLVYSFISLVHKHYKMHHEMSFYSKYLTATPKYISEKFNGLGIMSPHEFIKNRILVEVKRQLLYTDKTAKTICFDVGFNDPAYFARFFKKNIGMTSREFKEFNIGVFEKKKNIQ